MYIIKFVLLSLYIFLTSFFIGKAFSKLMKKEFDTLENIVSGFIVNVACVQILLWPMVAFSLSKIIFCVLTFFITIIPTIIGVIIFIKERKALKSEETNKETKQDIKPIILKVIFVLLILVQIIFTVIYYRSDADDSFYVSNSTLFKVEDNLNEYDSSFGDEELGTVPMYDFQIWESLITYYSIIFVEEPVIVAHTFLIPILIILSSLASYMLGRKLLQDDKKAYLFSIFLIIFNLFGGYSTYSFGSRLLSRAWQGKSLYLCIVFPVLVAYMLDSFENLDKKLYLSLFICTLASIGFNPTSLFVIGFEILFMIIALAIARKNWKYLLHMIPSALAIAFFTVFVYIRTSKFAGQIDAASTITFSQIVDIWKRFFAGRSVVYLAVYVLSCIYIFLRGTGRQKTFLIYAPILLLVFVWNPISGKFVAENITKVSTFWRVYWLVPVSYGILTAVLMLLDKIKKENFKYLTIIATALFIVVFGEWLISEENGFIKANNIYKLPNETIIYGDIISNTNNDKNVVAMEGVNTTLRQKYTNITLIYSRRQYVMDLFYYRGKQQEAMERMQLQDIIDGTEKNLDNLENLLNKYDIGWVIISKDNTDAINKICEYGYVIEKEMDGSCLIKSQN